MGISVMTTCPATESASIVLCPSHPPCPLCPAVPSCPSSNSQVAPIPTPAGGAGQGPCPAQGYTCEECLDGWFCPPPLTPAQPAPCGYGWPCYHCANGWFCVPVLTVAPTTLTFYPGSVSANTTPGSPLGPQVPLTVTSTTFTTVPATASPVETLHPAVAGWQYGGCYKDDASRALKNDSITAAVVGGMTTTQCISFCRGGGYSLAGTEAGYMCFCGDVLIDSWPLEDSDCDTPCVGDSACFCGGTLTLSVWSPDGKVPRAYGPEHEFTMPVPTLGQTAMEVDIGGVRQTVVKITTLVDEWPAINAHAVMTATLAMKPAVGGENFRKASAEYPVERTDLDVNGIASTVHAIVSAAMVEAQHIAASEIAKANSMIAGAKSIVGMGFENMAGQLNGVVADAFPEMLAWTTCTTTITSCSTTTTIGMTTTCITSGFVSTTPDNASGAAPVGPQPGTNTLPSTSLPTSPLGSPTQAIPTRTIPPGSTVPVPSTPLIPNIGSGAGAHPGNASPAPGPTIPVPSTPLVPIPGSGAGAQPGISSATTTAASTPSSTVPVPSTPLVPIPSSGAGAQPGILSAPTVSPGSTIPVPSTPLIPIPSSGSGAQPGVSSAPGIASPVPNIPVTTGSGIQPTSSVLPNPASLTVTTFIGSAGTASAAPQQQSTTAPTSATPTTATLNSSPSGQASGLPAGQSVPPSGSQSLPSAPSAMSVPGASTGSPSPSSPLAPGLASTTNPIGTTVAAPIPNGPPGTGTNLPGQSPAPTLQTTPGVPPTQPSSMLPLPASQTGATATDPSGGLPPMQTYILFTSITGDTRTMMREARSFVA
ncbi:hypothetical protein B0H66DRAFT_494743 [Apodospora peruviana]|uniref:WSC domain-containing protein n=1 Tax=Apodospora peruviana TaxID=516989 RepID=A0AAE0ID14_9PEZI|nr:hypothetical protein B0H66DRAFT_494743 [Apodospora peruviana]